MCVAGFRGKKMRCEDKGMKMSLSSFLIFFSSLKYPSDSIYRFTLMATKPFLFVYWKRVVLLFITYWKWVVLFALPFLFYFMIFILV